MKSFRWTLILFVGVAALVAFTVIDFKRSEKTSELTEREKNVVKIAVDAINRVEIVTRTGQLVVEKLNSGWELTAPSRDRADQQAVESLLSQLESQKTSAVVAEGQGINWETFGLKEPITVLKLASSDGKKETIQIGSVKAFDQSLYARIDDDPRVLSVAQSWDALLAKVADDLRDKHLLRSAIDVKDIGRIRFTGPRPLELTVSDEAKGVKAWRVARGGPDYPVDPEQVAQFIDQLKGVRAQGFAPAGAKAAGKPAGGVELLSMTDAKSLFAATLIATQSPATVNAISSDYKNEVLILNQPAAAPLEHGVQDFYDKKRPFQFTVADIGRIEIESDALKGAFTKKGGAWQAVDPGLQARLDGTKLSELVSKIGQLRAVRILEPIKGSTLKLSKPSRIVLMKSSGEPVLEFVWGDVVTEHAAKNAADDAAKSLPEARYHPARTDKTGFWIGVTESEIKALGLQSIAK